MKKTIAVTICAAVFCLFLSREALSMGVNPKRTEERRNVGTEELKNVGTEERKDVKTEDPKSLLAEIKILKKKNEDLEKQMKELAVKKGSIIKTRDELGKSKSKADSLDKERQRLRDNNERLQINIDTLKKERSALYANLGNAYAKTGMFDAAIESYRASLSANPNNGEVHYNLGLLYQHSDEDTDKATYHFKRALELTSSAKKKRELLYLIKSLREGREWRNF